MWYKLSNPQKIMYIMRGPSGAGKSTKAKELGISGTTLSTDDFWIKDGKYLWDINKLTEAHLWNQKRTEEVLKQSISPVIIDNTNIELWSMKPYVQMALKYGYKVQLVPVEVKNTAKELAERNKHGVPESSIQSMIDRYNPRATMIDILKSNPPEIKKIAQNYINYGEYWIDEDGNTLWADGDNGDMNHEMYVIQRAQGMIAPEEYSQGEYVQWKEFIYSIASGILQQARTNPNKAKQIEKETGEPISQLSENDIIGYGMVEEELLRRGIDKDLLNAAMDKGDTRNYGMKEWGWKRVENKNIQTFFLNPKDIQSIVKGLSEIASEDEEGNSTWNIEVMSNGNVFYNIPLSVIERGPAAINSFSRKQRIAMYSGYKFQKKGWYTRCKL